MNEHAKKWVEALRSAEFKQGKGRLRLDDDAYCCLGVACELYRRETGRGIWRKPLHHAMSFELLRPATASARQDPSWTQTLPPEVANWLGVQDGAGVYQRKDDDAFCFSSLVLDNDRGATFKMIADIIESEPPKLFKEAEET